MANRGLNKGRGLGALIPKKNKAAADNAKEQAVSGEQVDVKEPAGAKETETPKEQSATTTEQNNADLKDKKPTKEQKQQEKASDIPTTDKKELAPARKPESDEKVMSTDVVFRATRADNGIMMVRLTDIVPSRKQPRKVFEDKPIQELTESIKAHGIVTPLLVRKKGAYFELIAGERR